MSVSGCVICGDSWSIRCQITILVYFSMDDRVVSGPNHGPRVDEEQEAPLAWQHMAAWGLRSGHNGLVCEAHERGVLGI